MNKNANYTINCLFKSTLSPYPVFFNIFVEYIFRIQSESI